MIRKTEVWKDGVLISNDTEDSANAEDIALKSVITQALADLDNLKTSGPDTKVIANILRLLLAAYGRRI